MDAIAVPAIELDELIVLRDLSADGAAAVLEHADTDIDTGSGTPTSFVARIEINTTGAAIDERIGTVDLRLAEGSYVAVAIQVEPGDALEIGDLSVSGGFRFVGGTTGVSITVTDGRFVFGEFEIEGVNGTISWDGAAFSGNLVGSVSYNANNVKIAGQIHASLGASFAVSSPALTIEIAGNVLTAGIAFDDPANDTAAFTVPLAFNTAPVNPPMRPSDA